MRDSEDLDAEAWDANGGIPNNSAVPSGHCLWLLLVWHVGVILCQLIPWKYIGCPHFHFFWSSAVRIRGTCRCGRSLAFCWDNWNLYCSVLNSVVRWSGPTWNKEDFLGWIVGLQLCMGLYLFFGGTGLSIPFSGKTYSLHSEEMMKWCPSVGPWIVAVDGWHPHEEMQIQHMTLHVYQWNPTLCLLQHGSRTYVPCLFFCFCCVGAKFGTSSNSSEAPWSMKSYHTETIRVYSQGVNVGKYLKLKSSSWDKPTFHLWTMTELGFIERSQLESEFSRQSSQAGISLPPLYCTLSSKNRWNNPLRQLILFTFMGGMLPSLIPRSRHWDSGFEVGKPRVTTLFRCW